MKTKTNFNKTIALVIVYIIVLLIVGLSFQCLFADNGSAFAETEVDLETIYENCKNFTENERLYNDTKKTIRDYENYIDETFKPNWNNTTEGITDEWILKIVPVQLFENQFKNFLYIGESYGFYFNYYEESKLYFIYLMLHELELDKISGHIIRTITPLYYENYVFDKESGKVSLEYIKKDMGDPDKGEEIIQTYYQKYSGVKNVYLKNIGFNGSLYNYDDYNDGDDKYVAKQDNGGYFIGGSYRFNGVSTQSGKSDFTTKLFLVAISPIGGGAVGTCESIIDMIIESNNLYEDLKSDFRDKITNERDYSFNIVDIERDKQYERYGHLLKNYLSVLDTPDTKDGVLFGIRNKNYAQSTMYYNFANEEDKGNTGFVGRVKLDIVEENENIFGSTVSPIAKDVESNAINKDVYNSNILRLEESIYSDIYVLKDRNREINFTAPENGIYTFETFGTVKNKFNSNLGAIIDKSDGVNQQLTVELKKGQSFKFGSQNISNNNGVYQIKVEFTPREITQGNKMSFDIKAGESEYAVFNNVEGIGFLYSMSDKGNYSVAIAIGERENVINLAIMDEKTKNAIATGFSGKYYIRISNIGESDLAVSLEISPASKANIGQAYDIELGHATLLEISPSPTNCSVKFNAVCPTLIRMRLLNDNCVEILSSDNNTNPTFTKIAEEGAKYYLLLESEDLLNSDVRLDITYDLPKLVLGENTIADRQFDNTAYLLSLRSDARVSISATDGILITLFDDNWQFIEEQEGFYSLTEAQNYYALAKGAASAFTINIDVEHTDSLSGTMTDRDYRFIKFEPTKSGFYEVKGILSYQWYDSLLRPYSGQLYDDSVYYLKIYGEINTDYNVSIVRECIGIVIRSQMDLTAGLYSFEIEEAGTYVISTVKEKNTTAFYDLTDFDNNVIDSNIAIGGKYAVHFDIGDYYIEIDSQQSIGILINRLNSDNEEQNQILVEGIEQFAEFTFDLDNSYVFTPSVSAIYYFKISYSSTIINFDITISDGVNIVDIKEIELKPFLSNTLSKRYGVEAELAQGKTYYINVFCSKNSEGTVNAGDKSVSVGILISMPNIIEDVNLVAIDSADEVNVIKAGKKNGIKSVSMGRTYTIETPNVKNVNYKLNDNYKGCSIKGNQLIIEFDESIENNLIDIIFVDDTDKILIATVEIKYPYYAKAEFDATNLQFSTILTDRYGFADVFDGSIISTKLKIGNVVFSELSATEISVLSLIKDDPAFLNGEWRFESEVEILYAGEHQYTMKSDVITAATNKVLLENLNGTLTVDGILIVDARNCGKSDIHFNVPSTVNTFILWGRSNNILNDVRIGFINSEKLVIYMLDYKVNTNTGVALNAGGVTKTDIYFEGNNEIIGNTGLYLVRTKKVNFIGSGILNISGKDGDNGADGEFVGKEEATAGFNGGGGAHGEDGKNGTSALFCSEFSKLGSGKITLRGGNGGNGGNGKKGGNGFGVGGLDNPENKWGGSGGNGGKGGHGGNSGAGCSISIPTGIQNVSVSSGYPGCGGDGGDGGNGGLGGFSKEIGYNTLTSATPGGRGGNGGDSGRCGIGDHDCKMPKGGDGGWGGDGGNGNRVIYNVAGALTSQYRYAAASRAGRGGDGGNGCVGGDGGDGGWGGDGANGGNASATILADDGQPGESGGNGGDGGDYYYSYGRPGEGGKGGSGGSGGKGGEKFALFKAGNPGADGKDGADGSRGKKYVASSSGGSGGDSCVATGTLITLADGRQVPVETLKGDEMLLVWDIFNGKFEISPILFVDKDEERMYNIINLRFSDGTSVKVIDEHGFWDFDLNKYVFLREDADKYIGHYFNKQTVDEEGNFGYTKVRLEEVEITQEYTAAWSPVTYGHLCYYVNGMLSMPGATGGLINIFDVDAKTMTVDKQAYEFDIELYGLYTYEEFSSKYEIPQEIFEAFGGKYLKAAIGKGLITEDEISALITRYSAFWQAND